MPFLNGEHSVIFESCWIFIYPYFESGSRKDKNLSPPSLCILEFHCILWQPVLNIILHIFIPRKNLSRLWIIFLLTHFGGEFLRNCVQRSWIVDLWASVYFDRIHFVWLESSHTGCYLYSQFIPFSFSILNLCHSLINGQGPIVFCWILDFFRRHLVLIYSTKVDMKIHLCCVCVHCLKIQIFRGFFRNLETSIKCCDCKECFEVGFFYITWSYSRS